MRQTALHVTSFRILATVVLCVTALLRHQLVDGVWDHAGAVGQVHSWMLLTSRNLPDR